MLVCCLLSVFVYGCLVLLCDVFCGLQFVGVVFAYDAVVCLVLCVRC